MNAFVKPSARTKFGIAAASSVALVIAPTVALPANAASFSVTNCNTSGAGSLAAALEASNSAAGPNTIDISTSADCTITLTETLYVNESVSITNSTQNDFSLHTDASLSGPIMSVWDSGASSYERVDLTIDGLQFNGNNVDTGYALLEATDSYTLANIAIYNSVFANAENSAIFVHSQIGLVTRDTRFNFNDSSYGGAIQSVGTDLGIIDSDFFSNTAKNGGSIFHMADSEEVDGENVLVYGSTFTAGYAFYGGAISINSMDQDGMAPYLLSGANLIVQDTEFTDNDASGSGGAIFAIDSRVVLFGSVPLDSYGYNAEETEYDLLSYGSSFTGNSALYGGAVAVGSGALISIGSYFYDNSAASGGAVFSSGDAEGELEDSQFVMYLDTLKGNDATSFGSAVNVSNHFDVIFALNSVSDNHADVTGALFFSSNHTTWVTGNTVANNSSDSYFPGMTLDVALSRLPEAVSASEFGAVVTHNTFVNNSSSDSSSPSPLFLTGDYEDFALGGNIFAASDASEQQILSSNPMVDLGANLLTGPAVSLHLNTLPSYPAPVDGASAMVSWEQLDLQPLAVNATNPDNFAWWETIATGDDSVARDYYDFESPGISIDDFSLSYLAVLPFDARLVERMDENGQPIYGNGFDVGAYEYGWNLTTTPIDPNIVITDVSKSNIAAGGDTFSVYGRGLDDVTELYVAGVKVSFKVVSATELLVTTGALPIGEAEILAIATDGRATFQLAVGVVEEASYWTKNLGNGQAKLYAKNIVGEGKVQFFLNGKEIAWINAIDESDPKLRKANGAAYLVRTVNLVEGKNRLEVKVDGVRVRFTTYSR